MILGLENTEAYNECLDAILNRDSPPCQVCLLRPPSVCTGDDQHDTDLTFPFPRASIGGLFASSAMINPHRLSYVDIVQKNVTTNSHSERKEEQCPTFATRKVSNASTISTQADEGWPDTKGWESTSFREVSKQGSREDLTSMISDFSELSCTTRQRKSRMASSKKDVQGKKHENGLLAVAQCPREEPDKSLQSRF
jgi:hypothetical protein